MFENTFKNIDDILYKDAGADSELDYIGQTSWVLFLRYLDELEQEKADEAALRGKPYEYIIDEEYQWPTWAMPKTADGQLDHHKAMTGPDLVQFVDLKLFPYLAGFKLRADNPQTIEYKIGEIFSELKNKIQSGYNLREILELADELPFRSSENKHELSHLYETKIKNMGNADRNGGQYYTPRPLIRAMIQVTAPQIGEKVYDGTVGSAGFLCEAYEHMYERMDKTTKNLETLQEKTSYGKEKKNLAYVIGVMNMILHGIEAPNIIHINTLSENIRDIQEKNRYHVILANPPFGGKERKEIQQNFDIKTGETAFLFLQHFIKSLKAGGRAAIVIKNTFLSNTDNASISLRAWKEEISAYLAGLRLLMHPDKTQIYPVEQGVPFLGFRVYPNYRQVLKQNTRRYRRFLRKKLRLRKAGQLSPDSLELALNSWLGHIRFGQAKRLEYQVFWYLRRHGVNLFKHPGGSWRVLERKCNRMPFRLPQQEQS